MTIDKLREKLVEQGIKISDTDFNKYFKGNISVSSRVTAQDFEDVIINFPYLLYGFDGISEETKDIDDTVYKRKVSPMFSKKVMDVKANQRAINYIARRIPYYYRDPELFFESDEQALATPIVYETRDPLINDVPEALHTDFWGTWFRDAWGDLANQLILKTYDEMRYPYPSENIYLNTLIIPSLFEKFFEENITQEELDKGAVPITFRNLDTENDADNDQEGKVGDIDFLNSTIENQIQSVSRFMDYTLENSTLISKWIESFVLSSRLSEKEGETEKEIYKLQDLKNELLRRKFAGSSTLYKLALASVGRQGSFISTIELGKLTDNSQDLFKDKRLIRVLHIPGVMNDFVINTTYKPIRNLYELPMLNGNEESAVPLDILAPLYYNSTHFSASDFYNYADLANGGSMEGADASAQNRLATSEYPYFKEASAVLSWDCPYTIEASEFVKKRYFRLDDTYFDSTLQSYQYRKMDISYKDDITITNPDGEQVGLGSTPTAGVDEGDFYYKTVYVYDEATGKEKAIQQRTLYRSETEPKEGTEDKVIGRMRLDMRYMLFDLDSVSGVYLDINANKILYHENSLQALNKGEYPYVTYKLSEDKSLCLMDTYWMEYLKNTTKNKTRVQDSVDYGCQISFYKKLKDLNTSEDYFFSISYGNDDGTSGDKYHTSREYTEGNEVKYYKYAYIWYCYVVYDNKSYALSKDDIYTIEDTSLTSKTESRMFKKLVTRVTLANQKYCCDKYFSNGETDILRLFSLGLLPFTYEELSINSENSYSDNDYPINSFKLGVVDGDLEKQEGVFREDFSDNRLTQAIFLFCNSDVAMNDEVEFTRSVERIALDGTSSTEIVTYNKPISSLTPCELRDMLYSYDSTIGKYIEKTNSTWTAVPTADTKAVYFIVYKYNTEFNNSEDLPMKELLFSEQKITVTVDGKVVEKTVRAFDLIWSNQLKLLPFDTFFYGEDVVEDGEVKSYAGSRRFKETTSGDSELASVYKPSWMGLCYYLNPYLNYTSESASPLRNKTVSSSKYYKDNYEGYDTTDLAFNSYGSFTSLCNLTRFRNRDFLCNDNGEEVSKWVASAKGVSDSAKACYGMYLNNLSESSILASTNKRLFKLKDSLDNEFIIDLNGIYGGCTIIKGDSRLKDENEGGIGIWKDNSSYNLYCLKLDSYKVQVAEGEFISIKDFVVSLDSYTFIETEEDYGTKAEFIISYNKMCASAPYQIIPSVGRNLNYNKWYWNKSSNGLTVALNFKSNFDYLKINEECIISSREGEFNVSIKKSSATELKLIFKVNGSITAIEKTVSFMKDTTNRLAVSIYKDPKENSNLHYATLVVNNKVLCINEVSLTFVRDNDSTSQKGIDVFKNFQGEIFDYRLYNEGFIGSNLMFVANGLSREIYSYSPDNLKLAHSVYIDPSIFKQTYSDDGDVLTMINANLPRVDSIRLFNRSVWDSILIDTHPNLMEEYDSSSEVYYKYTHDPYKDIDIYKEDINAETAVKEYILHDAIEQTLKEGIEVFNGVNPITQQTSSGGTESENATLVYRGNSYTMKWDDIISCVTTNLYPVEYRDELFTSTTSIYDKTRFTIDDEGYAKTTNAISLKAKGIESSLAYFADFDFNFISSTETDLSTCYSKGLNIELVCDEDGNTSLKQKEPNLNDSNKNHILFPLMLPRQYTNSEDEYHGISSEGGYLDRFILRNVCLDSNLNHLLKASSYYSEVRVPVLRVDNLNSTPYFINKWDGVRTLKEGSYYITCKYPFKIIPFEDSRFNSNHTSSYNTLYGSIRLKLEVKGTPIKYDEKYNLTSVGSEYTHTSLESTISRTSGMFHADDNRTFPHRIMDINLYVMDCDDIAGLMDGGSELYDFKWTLIATNNKEKYNLDNKLILLDEDGVKNALKVKKGIPMFFSKNYLMPFFISEYEKTTEGLKYNPSSADDDLISPIKIEPFYTETYFEKEKLTIENEEDLDSLTLVSGRNYKVLFDYSAKVTEFSFLDSIFNEGDMAEDGKEKTAISRASSLINSNFEVNTREYLYDSSAPWHIYPNSYMTSKYSGFITTEDGKFADVGLCGSGSKYYSLGNPYSRSSNSNVLLNLNSSYRESINNLYVFPYVCENIVNPNASGINCLFIEGMHMALQPNSTYSTRTLLPYTYVKNFSELKCLEILHETLRKEVSASLSGVIDASYGIFSSLSFIKPKIQFRGEDKSRALAYNIVKATEYDFFSYEAGSRVIPSSNNGISIVRRGAYSNNMLRSQDFSNTNYWEVEPKGSYISDSSWDGGLGKDVYAVNLEGTYDLIYDPSNFEVIYSGKRGIDSTNEVLEANLPNTPSKVAYFYLYKVRNEETKEVDLRCIRYTSSMKTPILTECPLYNSLNTLTDERLNSSSNYPKDYVYLLYNKTDADWSESDGKKAYEVVLNSSSRYELKEITYSNGNTMYEASIINGKDTVGKYYIEKNGLDIISVKKQTNYYEVKKSHNSIAFENKGYVLDSEGKAYEFRPTDEGAKKGIIDTYLKAHLPSTAVECYFHYNELDSSSVLHTYHIQCKPNGKTESDIIKNYDIDYKATEYSYLTIDEDEDNDIYKKKSEASKCSTLLYRTGNLTEYNAKYEVAINLKVDDNGFEYDAIDNLKVYARLIRKSSDMVTEIESRKIRLKIDGISQRGDYPIDSEKEPYDNVWYVFSEESNLYIDPTSGKEVEDGGLVNANCIEYIFEYSGDTDATLYITKAVVRTTKSMSHVLGLCDALLANSINTYGEGVVTFDHPILMFKHVKNPNALIVPVTMMNNIHKREASHNTSDYSQTVVYADSYLMRVRDIINENGLDYSADNTYRKLIKPWVRRARYDRDGKDNATDELMPNIRFHRYERHLEEDGTYTKRINMAECFDIFDNTGEWTYSADDNQINVDMLHLRNYINDGYNEDGYYEVRALDDIRISLFIDRDEPISLIDERFSLVANCFNLDKFKEKKSSPVAVTNIQLLQVNANTLENHVLYEMEYLPIIYDELYNHISLNIMIHQSSGN